MQPAFSHWIGVHGTLSKGSWSAGAECLPWVVGLASVGPGGGSWLKKKKRPKNMSLLLPQPWWAGKQKWAGDQAGLEMLSRAFGRKGEDKVLGLFKQLQWISSSLSPVLPLLHSSPCYAKENKAIPKSAIYHSAAESHCRAEPALKLESKRRDVFRWGLRRAAKTCCRSKGEQEEEWRGKHWRGKGQTWLCCKQSQLG